jgi:hypothetical protein
VHFIAAGFSFTLIMLFSRSEIINVHLILLLAGWNLEEIKPLKSANLMNWQCGR